MGLTNMKKNRPILLTGKTGTGKSTKAKTFVNNPIIVYANEMGIKDVFSIPIDDGIIIEDVHHKAKKEEVLFIIRNYKGQIVLTSINEKDVPKEIKNLCQIKRAGGKNYLRESIKNKAPRSEEPVLYKRDTYSLVREYLKQTDRDLMAELLVYNKPPDVQILSWLCENVHPNKLVFIDSVVKRRWSQRYFYEMLAYRHDGLNYGRLKMPQRKSYSKKPYLARKLGISNSNVSVLKQLLNDEGFAKYVRNKLNNADSRLLGLKEKERRTKRTPTRIEVRSLTDYFNGE
jgi:energy-coupling factor transporter ATP-binding protein EcfA2